MSRWLSSATFRRSAFPILLERAAEIRVEPFRLSFDRLEFWPRPKVASLIAATVPTELSDSSPLKRVMLDVGCRAGRRSLSPAHHGRAAGTRVCDRAIERKGRATEWSSFELDGVGFRPGGVSYVR